jgi:superfamily II DNA or RNA helicase
LIILDEAHHAVAASLVNNCSLISEGFGAPDVAALLMLRPNTKGTDRGLAAAPISEAP